MPRPPPLTAACYSERRLCAHAAVLCVRDHPTRRTVHRRRTTHRRPSPLRVVSGAQAWAPRWRVPARP
eukprot:4861466-Pleurochrysis_carterae.AAC.1